jgi:hypothetical protein
MRIGLIEGVSGNQRVKAGNHTSGSTGRGFRRLTNRSRTRLPVASPRPNLRAVAPIQMTALPQCGQPERRPVPSRARLVAPTLPFVLRRHPSLSKELDVLVAWLECGSSVQEWCSE